VALVSIKTLLKFWVVITLGVWVSPLAWGLILLPGDSGVPASDRPPDRVVGYWVSTSAPASAVAVSPNQILTCRHQGGGVGSLVRFNGITYKVSEQKTYGTADIRLCRIVTQNDQPANLSGYVNLYTGSSENDVVMGGWGRIRGTNLQAVDPEEGVLKTYGYNWGGTAGNNLLWGTNNVYGWWVGLQWIAWSGSRTVGAFTSDVIAVFFDGPNSASHEATVAQGDSGGGWFIYCSGQWELAASNAYVTSHNDGEAWYALPSNPDTPYPDTLFGIRVSSYAPAINPDIQSWVVLTETINQAAGQADPARASPINFTVVFNKPVFDFTTGDVTLGGTAGATTAIVTGSGTTYNVAVSGMTQAGTVTATIPAGVAHDAEGRANFVSASTDNTVTYNPTVTVTGTVSYTPYEVEGAYLLTDVTVKLVKGGTVGSDGLVSGGTVIGSQTLTFDGSGNDPQSYSFTTTETGAAIVVIERNTLTGWFEASQSVTLVNGSAVTANLALEHALRGDVNMDGMVDGYDIDAVFDAANAGSTDLKYDLDGSGTVDTADAEYLIYTILHSEYGDADLSGTADAGDYDYWFFGLENGIQPDMSRWTAGDFDGSGNVDAGDYDCWFFGLEN
jgi:hypothetical protein